MVTFSNHGLLNHVTIISLLYCLSQSSFKAKSVFGRVLKGKNALTKDGKHFFPYETRGQTTSAKKCSPSRLQMCTGVSKRDTTLKSEGL